jgi:transcriptional regulator with XRE-family HTH domain
MATTIPIDRDALRRHREIAGLEQQQLAALAGISRYTVCRLERGRRTRTSVRTYKALTTALDIDYWALRSDRETAVAS